MNRKDGDFTGLSNVTWCTDIRFSHLDTLAHGWISTLPMSSVKPTGELMAAEKRSMTQYMLFMM